MKPWHWGIVGAIIALVLCCLLAVVVGLLVPDEQLPKVVTVEATPTWTPAPTWTATNTPVPTLTYTPIPTWSPTVVSTPLPTNTLIVPTPTQVLQCICDYNAYNCSDPQAVECFKICGDGDIHDLDRDHDGIPCERN